MLKLFARTTPEGAKLLTTSWDEIKEFMEDKFRNDDNAARLEYVKFDSGILQATLKNADGKILIRYKEHPTDI